jgi:cytochrome P450
MGIMRQNPMTPAGAAPGCPVDESFDPLAPEFLADPYTIMAGLPDGRKPVFFAPSIGYYVVTSYDAIQQVFGDPRTYSAAVAQAPLAPLTPEAQQILLAGGHKPQPSMVSLDEPEHARLRRPAARAFSMKRVTAMIPAIEATTTRLLDAVNGSEEFDLVGALAFPLPANIVFSLMGVPAGDFAQLKQWCGYRAALAWGRPAPEDQVEIATSMAAYRKYLRDLVDAKTRAPADDLTSDLIAIHREAPDRLTLDEIASILFSLSFAGHETTTGLIGNTVRRLLEDPGRWIEIVARPDLIPEPSTRPSATIPPFPSGAGSPPARSPWPTWTCPPGPGSSCGWPPRAATRKRSTVPPNSIWAERTPITTWPSAGACTTAWAPISASSKPRSRWPNSPVAFPPSG